MTGKLIRSAVASVGMAACMAVFVPVAEGALILEYNMGQAQPQVEDPMNTADGGDITRGAGLTDFLIAASDGYPSQPVLHVNPAAGATTAAAAWSANSIFSFSVSAGSAVQDLDLTNLTFNAARGGVGTPRGFEIRVDSPTTTNETIKTATDVPTVRTVFTTYDIPLSSIPSLQNLTAGQVVNFKVAIYAPSTGNSLEFDDIRIHGNATVPEPGVAGGLGIGLAGLLLRRRRAAR